jgi:predicted chitinase
VTKEDHIRLILDECKRQGIVSRNALAYIMATVQHETANTFTPLDEYGGRNTRYAPYWGRGYVQLTWKANYQKYSALTGKDLVGQPHLAKDPKTAAFILVHGFKHGTFTGRKISDYIGDRFCDFTNARRCINGTDKAVLIANYAREWVSKIGRYTV